MSAAPFPPVSGNSGLAQAVTPVRPVVAANVARDTSFQRGGAALSTQPPGDDGQTGWVAVHEALYRLRANWSAASHDGEKAVVSLPLPDVIAIYHRYDTPSPAAEAERAAAIAAHVDVIV